jgi:HlyD family secretion protein
VQVTTDAATLRIVAGTELAAWNNELGGITPSTPGATLENMLLAGRAHLTAVRALLDKAMEAVIGGASSLDASTAVTYKSYVTTSRTNVNAALTSMNEELESIAAQKITVSQAKDQLNLKLAGSDPQDILAQEATVAQMDAAARAAEVQLQKSVLRSPIDGILTRQDAKAGALATANQSVASVISSGALQIEANIAEVDIAKISVGDPATVTLDAYGSEVHFDAVVTSIDPAEILIEGIATYKAKFQFAKDDNRILPGMTANIEIQTERRENALLIPQRAVASRNGKKLVWVAGENGEFREQEVMIGFRGSDGNIEVLQGLEEGTRIAAIPPKE